MVIDFDVFDYKPNMRLQNNNNFKYKHDGVTSVKNLGLGCCAITAISKVLKYIYNIFITLKNSVH